MNERSTSWIAMAALFAATVALALAAFRPHVRGCGGRYLIGRGSAESAAATVTTTASEGHSGAKLPAHEFGDLPAMLAHFKEEGLPVPTFQDDQMADLVAYLHSARARPVRKRAGGSSSDLRKFFAGLRAVRRGSGRKEDR